MHRKWKWFCFVLTEEKETVTLHSLSFVSHSMNYNCFYLLSAIAFSCFRSFSVVFCRLGTSSNVAAIPSTISKDLACLDEIAAFNYFLSCFLRLPLVYYLSTNNQRWVTKHPSTSAKNPRESSRIPQQWPLSLVCCRVSSSWKQVKFTFSHKETQKIPKNRLMTGFYLRVFRLLSAALCRYANVM